VGQQAIEFWSTICDEEVEIMEEVAEALESHRQPERTPQNFIRGALPYLVPLLLEALCKQADDDDEEWNVAMAAASCLARVALTVEDEVVQHVMPFIEKHITSTDWRRREAATGAFGSILEGPSQQVLQPYMPQAIDLMIRLMRDSSVQVKDTAAWTIGRVCEHQIASISAQQWRQMTHALQPGEPAEAEGVLLAGLKDEPRVAANVCTALHSLAIHCENTRNEPSNVLSMHFVDLARALLQCTERSDANENNLRTSAYEALNTTLTNAALDTLPHIEQLLPVIASRLQGSFSIQIVSNDDRESLNDLQGLLCGSLQVVTQKLGDRARPYADQLMELFLKVFGSKNATLHEEALMAVGAVANGAQKQLEGHARQDEVDQQAVHRFPRRARHAHRH
jgi:importin subunit beta-1